MVNYFNSSLTSIQYYIEQLWLKGFVSVDTATPSLARRETNCKTPLQQFIKTNLNSYV